MNAEEFNPVFIGGAGRSGTTLLRAMLASHANLTGTNEFKLLPNLADLRRVFDDFPEVRQAYKLTPAYIDSLFASLISDLFQPYIEQAGNLRLVEKTPHNVMASDVLTRLFPKSKMIHIIRDGRDVVCSLLEMDWRGADGQKLWYTGSVEGAATYWRQVVEAGLAQANGQQQCKSIHYESLISDPKKRMQKLVAWLGEDWDDAVLDAARRKGMVASEISESSSEQVSQALYSKSIGRWRKDMSPGDRQVFHRVAGELLVNLGYAKNDAWVS